MNNQNNLSSIMSYIGHILAMIHTKTVILASIFFSVVNNTVYHFIHKYIISDLEFVAYLLVLVMIDTGLGVIKHWKSKTLDSSGFGAFIIKLILYSALIILVHNLTNFKVNGVHPAILDWVDDVFYSGMMIREGISIIENIGAINPNIVPKWVANRLKKLDSEGFSNSDSSNNNPKTQ